MAEIMYELRSPAYFQQFQRQFKYFISLSKPNLVSFQNYAISEHSANTLSSYCAVCQPHFHVLLESDSDNLLLKNIDFHAVPCLYSSFLYLFCKFTLIETFGDILQKLKLAIEFNENIPDKDLNSSTVIQERLPPQNPLSNLLKTAVENNFENMQNPTVTKEKAPSAQTTQFVTKPTRPKNGTGHKSLLNSNSKDKSVASSCKTTLKKKTAEKVCGSSSSSSSTQTDFLPTETLERIENILNGPHAFVLCKFMDIVKSGYGKIDIDSDLLFVKLTYEEKIKF